MASNESQTLAIYTKIVLFSFAVTFNISCNLTVN